VARRAATALAVLVVSLAGVLALLAYVSARDDATAGRGGAAAAGPGRADPAADAPRLRLGNVELRYAEPADRAVLLTLARRIAGPSDPALAAAGQAVVVLRDRAAAPVLARAWRRSLRVPSAADPRLQEFVEAWLGRGAAG
jgi:hypothetical protein